MEFIGCTAMYLPPEMAVVAAETACRQNPVNRPQTNSAAGGTYSVLSPDHLAVLTGKYWGAGGVRLTVGFMEQVSNALKTRILSFANLWNKYGNVEFVPSSTDPQIRITLAGDGYWSYLGTDLLHIPKNDPTMCLSRFSMSTPESECMRVIPHEFGHSMGFPHEHMRRAIINKIDAQKAIAYFRQTQGWSPAMVMQQVLTPLAEASIMGTPDADEASIMTYSLPGLITTDGRPIIGGSSIAEQDMEFVAKIYPKQAVPPPPPEPPSGKGLDLTMDFERKVMSARLPAGWTIVKKSATEGVEIMAENQQLTALADELDECLSAATVPAGAEAAIGPFGKILAKAKELADLARAGKALEALNAFYDLLGLLLGRGDEGGISFAPQAKAAGLKFDLFKSILKRLLPLLLDAL